MINLDDWNTIDNLPDKNCEVKVLGYYEDDKDKIIRAYRYDSFQEVDDTWEFYLEDFGNKNVW